MPCRGGGPTPGRTNCPPAANSVDAPGGGGTAVPGTKPLTGRPGPAGLSFPIGGCIASNTCGTELRSELRV
jgi:hypothetical protein